MKSPLDIPPIATLEELIDLLSRPNKFQKEIKYLQAVNEWALSKLPFKEGDAVVIKSIPNIATDSGWYHHREHLVSGATGVVDQLSFSTYSKGWIVWYRPDVEWTVSRPEDLRKVYIRDLNRRHTFMFKIDQLRKRKETDIGLILPESESVK